MGNTADGLGEEPGWRGEGLGLGDPPSGEAAVNGDPAGMGEGIGNTPGEGAGLALGCLCVGGDCRKADCCP